MYALEQICKLLLKLHLLSYSSELEQLLDKDIVDEHF